jgi:hypothetical protein
MTKEEFTAWFMQAKPNDSIIYYTGFMAMNDKDEPVQALKKQVERAYDSGVVIVTQRRLGLGNYQYIATKAARPYAHDFFLARDA